MTTPEPYPEAIMRLRTALYPSFALLAGIQLDLFTALKDGPKSAGEIAEGLGVGSGKLTALLYVLVTAGLLTVDGDLFANSPESDYFLVRGSLNYMGGTYAAFAEDRWNAVHKTADSIRTGSAQAKVDWTTMSPEEQDSFFRSQHPASVRTAKELLARYDFSAHRHLLDVAGGTGGLAITITETCPYLRATVVDLPAMTPVTQRFVAQAGAADRVQVIAADAVNQPLNGSFDVAVMSAFIPVLSPDEAQRALRNVSQVMEPGGTLYIHDGGTLDDSRLSPLEIVRQNLWFINVFDQGEARTEQERRDWLSKAGFDPGERVTFPSGGSIMVARKP